MCLAAGSPHTLHFSVSEMSGLGAPEDDLGLLVEPEPEPEPPEAIEAASGSSSLDEFRTLFRSAGFTRLGASRLYIDGACVEKSMRNC